ncbi:MAG: glycosyltransferase family 39 protein [Peptostreptococcaceae bacterium]
MMILQRREYISQSIIISSLLLILSILVSIFWQIPVFPVLIFISPIWILVGLNVKYLSNKKSQILFIMIMLIKFLLMIYQAKYKSLPMGGNDWIGYNGHAINLLGNTDNFIELLFAGDVNFFSRIISMVYYVFGEHIELINCLVLLASIIQIRYIYKIGKILINDEKIINNVILISIVLPINFIFSITVLRETPIQLFFIISLYHMLEYFKNTKFKNFMFAILSSLIATMFHSGMVVILLLYIGLFIAYKKSTNKIKLNPISLTIIIGMLAILFYSGLLSPLLEKFNGIENITDVLEKGQYVAGNTAYVTQTPKNLIDLIIQTPYRFLMFSIAPLPWQVKDVGTIIALIIDAIPQYFIMYFMVNYILKMKCEDNQSKSIKIAIICIIVLVYVMFGWGTANFGTAMRHRSKISPMMILIVGIYVDYKKKKRIGNDKNE